MAPNKVAIIKRGRGKVPGGVERSIQARAHPEQGFGDFSMIPILMYWGEVADELSPWWSPKRDLELREIWKRDGMLSSTITTMQSILSTIGWTIEGDADAVAASRGAFENAEYGAGMKEFIKKIAEDWFTQDNGIFIELIGPGGYEEPLLTAPEGIAHLDAGRCWRTGNPEFPVLYLGQGMTSWVRLHWSRVYFTSPNPSAIEGARGIGFCVVSRIAALSRMMRDTIRYKMEKIGGRQTRAVMTVSGAPKKAVELAMESAERAAENRGQIKFSAVPIIASPAGGAKIEADLLEFAGVPDGFQWAEEVQQYMYILSLAFGIDARELWPSTQSGATKADAEVQHRKAMRKGVGDFVSAIEHFSNTRVTVGGAVFGFKPKDNEEDKAEAEVEKIRVDTASVMLSSQIVTPRGALTWLVNEGILPLQYLDNPELSIAGTLTGEAPAAVAEGELEAGTTLGGDRVSSDAEPTTTDESGQAGTAAKGLDSLAEAIYNKIHGKQQASISV